jgi:hypothetical protein
VNVLLVKQGQPGQDYYRMDQPAQAVSQANAGVTVRVQHGIATTMSRPLDVADQVVVDVDAGDADVVVLQAPKTVAMLQALRILQGKGVAVVVEIDDLLSAVPYGNPAYPALVHSGMARVALECARQADLVTAPTPALIEEYARHGRGAVIANAVPRRIAEQPPAYERDDEVVTVGWTGNVGVHPYDLQEMGSGLQQALDRTQGSSRFVVLGEAWDIAERLRLTEAPAEVPWVHDVDAYLARVGQLFDVGIAPLRADRFNAAKSWLKPLEYSARGVFCVRARTPEYERLGLGMPAKAPRDWARFITTGVQDTGRRRELAAAAREKVLAGHLTEHRVEEWVGAWREALEHRARSRPSAVAVTS